MNRAIKFRAWDTSKEDYSPHQAWFFIDGLGNAWKYETGKPAKDLVLEQFTGLLDKNGVEVCEGDVIAWLDYYGKRHTALVAWSDELARWDLSDDGTLPLGSIARQHPVEVIGNVHKHSHLFT
jgi:YopX protein